MSRLGLPGLLSIFLSGLVVILLIIVNVSNIDALIITRAGQHNAATMTSNRRLITRTGLMTTSGQTRGRAICVHMSDSLKNQGGDDSNLLTTLTQPAVSIGVGVAGLLIILFNRLVLSDLLSVSDMQSRSDLISVMACSAVLLNVLSEQEIATKDRDKVALVVRLKTNQWSNNLHPSL